MAITAKVRVGRAVTRPLGTIIVAALTLSACGNEASPPTAAPAPATSLPGSPSTSAAPPPTAAERLPDITVDDTAGGKVRLSDLTPAALPTLVWFWAPH